MLINNVYGEAPRGHGATHGARVVCWSHDSGGGATGRARPVDVGRSPGRKLLDIILLWFYIMVLCSTVLCDRYTMYNSSRYNKHWEQILQRIR